MGEKRIGYTTGVFDMFHIGHLNILRNAKENCDYLIVGVTTDEEVQRVKNRLPIISYNERSAIVEAIQYVDEVVPEKDTDKIKAWEDLKFNVLYKGSDWKGSQKWDNYETFFNPKQVEIVYFPYTEGTSSTKLRAMMEKILNS